MNRTITMMIVMVLFIVVPSTMKTYIATLIPLVRVTAYSTWWATNWCRRRDYLNCGALYVLTLMLIAKRDWINSLEGYDNILTLYYEMIVSVTWYKRSSNSHKYWNLRHHHFSMISVFFDCSLCSSCLTWAAWRTDWENFLWSSPIIRQRMILINTTRAKRPLFILSLRMYWKWDNTLRIKVSIDLI